MRTFNRLVTFIGGSVRRLVMLAVVVVFFGGQMLGLWQSPSLVNIDLGNPQDLAASLGAMPPAAGSGEIWSGGARAAENAAQHFEKHGAEFPFKDEAAYVDAAQKFVKSPPAATQIVIQDDGDEVFYNAGLNYFAVTSPEGRIRTFFRPDPKIHGYKTNQAYFEAQAKK